MPDPCMHVEGHPLHAYLRTNTPTPRTLHLSGPTHPDTTLIPRFDLPEPQRKHLLTCVAPSLTHMCVPTHPSAPSCTLPAVARIHVRVCGSQTHFCCLLQRFPLAFVNTETFLLLVLIRSRFLRAHHRWATTHTSKPQMLTGTALSSLHPAGWLTQQPLESGMLTAGGGTQVQRGRERRGKDVFLKRSLAAGLTG